MDIELLKLFFQWCVIINVTMLSIWFLAFVTAKDLVYRTQTKWFDMPRDKFDSIHYSAMANWKMSFFIFNVVPYIALVIIT